MLIRRGKRCRVVLAGAVFVTVSMFLHTGLKQYNYLPWETRSNDKRDNVVLDRHQSREATLLEVPYYKQEVKNHAANKALTRFKNYLPSSSRTKTPTEFQENTTSAKTDNKSLTFATRNIPQVHDNSRDFDKSNEEMQLRFAERKNLLRNVCSDKRYAIKNPNILYKKPHSVVKDQFLYCGIPKVGTTFMRWSLPSQLKKINNDNILPRRGEKESFIIVREPYSRVLSGYLGKIASYGDRTNWVKYRRLVVQNFRPNVTKEMANCANDVTFSEFMKYVIKSQRDSWEENEHWQPMFEQCSVCFYDYDYIIHLETFNDDLSYVLKTVNITMDVNDDDEEFTIRDKTRRFVEQRQFLSKCEDACHSLKNIWWSLQVRGFIARNVSMPLTGQTCKTITMDELKETTWNAHLESKAYMDSRQQKKEMMIELFLSVPLEDRLEFRDLFSKDFELFGYDSEPKDLFPELI